MKTPFRRNDLIYAVLALICLMSTLILYVSASPFWWYSFYLTAIVGALALRQDQSQSKLSLRGVLLFYLTAVLMGISVEAVRIIFDLWRYTPILNEANGVVGFILLGYFLMMLAMALVYEQVILRFGHWWIAALSLFALLILPVEVANRLVPVWEEPNFKWVYLLFAVGYAVEAFVAVFAFRVVFHVAGPGKR